MQIVSSLSPLALEHEGGTAVAMGYFDGIHIGHRAVIEGAVEWAKAHGAAPAVFTFKLPADSKMKGRRLLSTEDKHALIASLGVEYYLCPEFEEIRAMTPEQFVYGIVQDCHAKALFCGENFTFGAKAAGTPELLKELCARWGWKSWWCLWHSLRKSRCPPPASARHWRAAMCLPPTPCWGCPTPSASRCSTGRVWAARWVCPPSIRSTRRASRCPATASISPAPGSVIPGIPRPPAWDPAHCQFGRDQGDLRDLYPGFFRDLYGTDPVVEFYAYLSPSKKFDTLDELKACIDHAARRAKAYFAKA